MSSILEHPIVKDTEKQWGTMPFPTRKLEAWRYVSSELLKEMAFETSAETKQAKGEAMHILHAGQTPTLFIVDGALNLKSSKLGPLENKIKVTLLSEADTATQERVLKQAKHHADNDYASTYNLARCHDSVLISVDANTVIKEPVNIVIHSSETDKQTLERFHIDVARCSELSLVCRYQSADQGIRRNSEWTAHLQDGSSLSMMHMQNEQSDSLHISGYGVTCERDSRFNIHFLNEGARLIRNRIHTDLNGENAEAQFYGAAYLTGQQSLHHHLIINHNVPHCRSEQLFKNILDDASRSSFDGTVFVEKDAQQTDAQQLNKNLVLSKQARASTKPQLKIYADDVACAHGATIGQLEEEEVFYLKTRGLSDQQARDMLSFGFIRDAVDQVPLSSIKDEWTRDILLQQFDFKGENH